MHGTRLVIEATFGTCAATGRFVWNFISIFLLVFYVFIINLHTHCHVTWRIGSIQSTDYFPRLSKLGQFPAVQAFCSTSTSVMVALFDALSFTGVGAVLRVFVEFFKDYVRKQGCPQLPAVSRSTTKTMTLRVARIIMENALWTSPSGEKSIQKLGPLLG